MDLQAGDSTDPGAQRHTSDVRTYFERSAADFDNLYDESQQGPMMRFLNRRLRPDIVQRFIATLEHAHAIGARSVLDIGCGSGRYQAALWKQGVRRLVGLDMSEPMLEMARGRLSDTADGNVSFIRADFGEWQTDETFDLIVAMGFFDYQSDPAAHLTKMRSLARKSAIATFPRRHWIRTPIRRIRYFFKHCPVYFFDAHEIRELGAQAGFSRTEVIVTPKSTASYLATFWID